MPSLSCDRCGDEIFAGDVYYLIPNEKNVEDDVVCDYCAHAWLEQRARVAGGEEDE